MQIHFSDAYVADEASASKWAAFLGALPHGEEFGELSVRFVRPQDIAIECGPTAVACYRPSSNLIVTSPEPALDGSSPEHLLRHEYGHHLANHRQNPPWRAIVMGPKRWASSINVCQQWKAGALSLSDQGDGYSRNPAEGFAEAYRVLAESRAGVPTTTWEIVDQLFFPSGTALAAVAEDVDAPWSGPVHARVKASFKSGQAAQRFSLPTPRDGSLTVRVRAAGAKVELTLRGSNRELLAKGRALQGQTQLSLEICGHRSVQIEAVRKTGKTRPFLLETWTP